MFRFSRKSRKIIPAWTRIVIKGYAHGGPEAEEGCSVSLVSASGPQPNGARGTGRCATRSATRAANLIVPGNAANPIGDAVRQLYGREPSNFFFFGNWLHIYRFRVLYAAQEDHRHGGRRTLVPDCTCRSV